MLKNIFCQKIAFWDNINLRGIFPPKKHDALKAFINGIYRASCFCFIEKTSDESRETPLKTGVGRGLWKEKSLVATTRIFGTYKKKLYY